MLCFVITRDSFVYVISSWWIHVIELPIIFGVTSLRWGTKIWRKIDHYRITTKHSKAYPDSKVRVANMGPTWVLAALDGPLVGHMNLAIKVNLAHNSRDRLYLIIDFVHTSVSNKTISMFYDEVDNKSSVIVCVGRRSRGFIINIYPSFATTHSAWLVCIPVI